LDDEALFNTVVLTREKEDVL